MRVHALPPSTPRRRAPPNEQDDAIVFVHNATWADYERFVEIRGEKGTPRLTFAEGCLEIMSPSYSHEHITSMISHLVMAWCYERNVDATPLRQWTLKDAAKEKGLEPDECFIVGAPAVRPPRPDVAIEVVWTSGGPSKLAIYRELGVPEVWFWKDDAIQVFLLQDGHYVAVARSGFFRGLDLAQLVTFISIEPATQAVRAYRAALQAEP